MDKIRKIIKEIIKEIGFEPNKPSSPNVDIGSENDPSRLIDYKKLEDIREKMRLQHINLKLETTIEEVIIYPK